MSNDNQDNLDSIPTIPDEVVPENDLPTKPKTVSKSNHVTAIVVLGVIALLVLMMGAALYFLTNDEDGNDNSVNETTVIQDPLSARVSVAPVPAIPIPVVPVLVQNPIVATNNNDYGKLISSDVAPKLIDENSNEDLSNIDVFDPNHETKMAIADINLRLGNMEEAEGNQNELIQNIQGQIASLALNNQALLEQGKSLSSKLNVLASNNGSIISLRKQVKKLQKISSNKTKVAKTPNQQQKDEQQEVLKNFLSISTIGGNPYISIRENNGSQATKGIGEYINGWEILKISRMEQSVLVSNGNNLRVLKLKRRI